MITNYSKNCLGTVDFDGLFPGMRKASSFTCYPMSKAERNVVIQSDNRIGTINLDTGVVTMSKPRKGAAFIDMVFASVIGMLPAADLLLLKSHIMGTASGMAGTNGIVFTDNSGALEVFNVQF